MLTETQKAFILNLIEERKDILENKINTVQINLKKKTAWRQLTDVFNIEYPTERKTPEQVKDIYKRIKISIRKKAAKRKRDHYCTGGGPSDAGTKIDTIEEQVSRINPGISKETFNSYDDDAEENKENASHICLMM